MIVANKRTYRGPGVYIGRPSKWGNPFTVEEFGRKRAIELYDDWLMHYMINHNRNFLDELRDAPALICWCAPLACHGDVLKRRIEQLP